MTGFALGDLVAGLAQQCDPDRPRKPWRDSYDADSVEAKPWTKVLDGAADTWRIVKSARGRDDSDIGGHLFDVAFVIKWNIVSVQSMRVGHFERERADDVRPQAA